MIGGLYTARQGDLVLGHFSEHKIAEQFCKLWSVFTAAPVELEYPNTFFLSDAFAWFENGFRLESKMEKEAELCSLS